MSHRYFKGSLALAVLTVAAGCNDAVTTPEAREAEAAVTAPAMQAAVGGPRDVAAIEQIVATFDAAWTGNDPVTYAGQYAGAEWVGPSGAIVTDPAVLTGIYTGIISNFLAGTVRQSTIRNLTFLTGTIAILNIDARVTGFAAPPPGTQPWQPGILRALEKNILVKRGGEWRIVQHQQTIAAPGT